LFCNNTQHIIRIFKHLMVPKTNHLISLMRIQIGFHIKTTLSLILSLRERRFLLFYCAGTGPIRSIE